MISNKVHLFTLMQEGAVVITPNNRLSNKLLTDFFKTNGQTIEDKPRCLPYSAFLSAQFKQLGYKPNQNHPLLLTTLQLNYLWRRILTKHNFANDGLLQAVNEAWTRCHLWQINFTHPAFASTPQTKQFQQWSVELFRELEQFDAITEAQLVDYLLAQNMSFTKKTFIWVCFDDYTPQQIALQQALDTQGCQNYHFDLEEKIGHRYVYAAADEVDEHEQLIHWLSTCLAQGEQQIGVVVPDLKMQSQTLQRLLQQQFKPEQFNVSLGQALANYPLIAHALCWLNLDSSELSASEARLLLHSPYLAHSQNEMLARAQFMEESHVLQEFYFTHTAFVNELEPRVPQLAALVKGISIYPEKASINGWIVAFKNRLRNLGFPGEYSLHSTSYQCYQRFLLLFDEFKQLSLVTNEITKREALATFSHLAKSTIFQAKKAETTIQVLGLLEAAGCSFDSLWITGVTDQALPQNARLSAFIPISLQREKSMPHASPERERFLAKKIIDRFAHSSQQVIYSYPRLSDDKPNMVSPLITGLPPFTACEIPSLGNSSHLISYTEDYEIPWINQEKSAGGTAILANQAKCPFRAFAEHRLHAQTALAISEGPDAKERGQIIHKIMELLWQTLQDQQTLLRLDETQLDTLIEKAIHHALEPVITKRNYSFSPLFQEVELIRLKHLVHACLQWERQRPPFTVEALEQAYTINLAGMDFRVRVDRLDSVAEDKKWVIDYKSSLPQSLPWKEERPKEPQLLLYALLDETINALVFAQLKTGQLSCKGLSEENHEIAGIATIKKEESWSDYRQQWQAQLNELAEEFSRGHCPPQPASASVCQQCNFQSLCRFEVS